MWDVISICLIDKSTDSSIEKVIPNDISFIIKNSNIDKIFTNGKIATKLYEKYIKSNLLKDTICLPSTSSANASWSLQRLIVEWSKIKFL